MHFYVAAPPLAGTIRVEEIERAIAEHTRSWDDRLRERLVKQHRGARGRALAERYAELFTPEYKASTEVSAAVDDIRHIEALTGPGSIEIELADALGADADRFTLLKLYLAGEGIVLSDFLPLLENLGLRVFAEHSVTLLEGDGSIVLIRFLVQDRRGQRLDVDRAAPTLVPAILEIRAGRAENDSLNRLIVDAGLAWREVDLLRTYRNLAFQANAGPSRPALNEVLLRHPAVAEVSIVGRKHADWGEEVIAFVVARPGAAIGEAELDALCLDHIARFKRPRAYRFVEALPKNNYGKVLKTELRRLLNET